jgi:hypothetical protein
MSPIFGEDSSSIFGKTRAGADNLLANSGGVGRTRQAHHSEPTPDIDFDTPDMDSEVDSDALVQTKGQLPPRYYDTEPDHLAERNQAADALIAAAGANAVQESVVIDDIFPAFSD